MNAKPNEKVRKHLKALRELMAGHKLDVYLVPSADEHQNEYLPGHKKRREAISGFSGSAGDVAVCMEQAHLFVDSRYHLQAEQEVCADFIQVHKTGLGGAHDLPGWLTAHETDQGALRVGYDPFVLTLAYHKRLLKALSQDGSMHTARHRKYRACIDRCSARPAARRGTPNRPSESRSSAEGSGGSEKGRNCISGRGTGPEGRPGSRGCRTTRRQWRA